MLLDTIVGSAVNVFFCGILSIAEVCPLDNQPEGKLLPMLAPFTNLEIIYTST